jgi:hypothetical protein
MTRTRTTWSATRCTWDERTDIINPFRLSGERALRVRPEDVEIIQPLVGWAPWTHLARCVDGCGPVTVLVAVPEEDASTPSAASATR